MPTLSEDCRSQRNFNSRKQITKWWAKRVIQRLLRKTSQGIRDVEVDFETCWGESANYLSESIFKQVSATTCDRHMLRRNSRYDSRTNMSNNDKKIHKAAAARVPSLSGRNIRDHLNFFISCHALELYITSPLLAKKYHQCFAGSKRGSFLRKKLFEPPILSGQLL